mgnify:CR=1 FL=1
MHAHPLTCRGCGEYAEIPGGCSCPEAEPKMAELEHLPASMSMTGAGFHALELRAGFASEALDAPWLLPRVPPALPRGRLLLRSARPCRPARCAGPCWPRARPAG